MTNNDSIFWQLDQELKVFQREVTYRNRGAANKSRKRINALMEAAKFDGDLRGRSKNGKQDIRFRTAAAGLPK